MQKRNSFSGLAKFKGASFFLVLCHTLLALFLHITAPGNTHKLYLLKRPCGNPKSFRIAFCLDECCNTNY